MAFCKATEWLSETIEMGSVVFQQEALEATITAIDRMISELVCTSSEDIKG